MLSDEIFGCAPIFFLLQTFVAAFGILYTTTLSVPLYLLAIPHRIRDFLFADHTHRLCGLPHLNLLFLRCVCAYYFLLLLKFPIFASSTCFLFFRQSFLKAFCLYLLFSLSIADEFYVEHLALYETLHLLIHICVARRLFFLAISERGSPQAFAA